MEKAEKDRIIVFARNGFEQFYALNYCFLENEDYKPGKRMYRNMTSLNKMMAAYIDSKEDYIIKKDLVNSRWGGPSSYVQHERIITNFGLSDTSWADRDRSVLLLSEKGKAIRDKYIQFLSEHPGIDLFDYSELPDFAKEFFVDEIRNTTSQNMTLWKNVLLTALYLFTVLKRIPRYSSSPSVVPKSEEDAFIKCCNYQKDGNLMDVTYFSQPAHMLRNLDILDSDYNMTETGYRLLSELNIFKEIEVSIGDYEKIFPEEIESVEEILEAKVKLVKVDAPDRKKRSVKVSKTSKATSYVEVDFEAETKQNKKTGDLGERLVLEYEKAKLAAAKVDDIEDKVILTSLSKDYGNTCAFDILSFDPKTGSEIYIEVKTTTSSAETPFYISEAERSFSQNHSSQYRLYRVYDAIKTKTPKFYETEGYVGDNFTLKAVNYSASRELEK